MEDATISGDPRAGRASCGLLLYAGSWLGFGAWLAWAYVPDRVLHAWGVTWYPSKYWALALPAWALVALAFAFVAYFFANIMSEAPLDSLSVVTDAHARPLPAQCACCADGGVPPFADVPPELVSAARYGRPGAAPPAPGPWMAGAPQQAPCGDPGCKRCRDRFGGGDGNDAGDDDGGVLGDDGDGGRGGDDVDDDAPISSRLRQRRRPTKGAAAANDL